MKFGTIIDEIPYRSKADGDYGVRDNLGLEKANDYISNLIAPQITSRIGNISYFLHLLSAVDFAYNQVVRLNQQHEVKDANKPRHLFKFWLDIFELCLAWNFRNNNEKEFVGVNRLNEKIKNEEEFIAYINQIKSTWINKPVPLDDKFLTARISYVFNRYTYSLKILGLIEPDNNIRNVYKVKDYQLLNKYSRFKKIERELSVKDIEKQFYRKNFNKNNKINLANNGFKKKFWREILFNKNILLDTLEKYQIGGENLKPDVMKNNTLALKTSIENFKGDFEQSYINFKNRSEFIKALNDNKLSFNINDFESIIILLKIFNYFMAEPKNILDKLNLYFSKQVSINPSYFKKEIYNKSKFKIKSKDYNNNKLQNYLKKVMENDDALRDVIRFLRDFYNVKNIDQMFSILGNRVRECKGFTTNVFNYSKRNGEYYILPEYQKRLPEIKKENNEIEFEGFSARLYTIFNLYQQINGK